MANLNLRKLDDSVYEQLKIIATRHGVPMEEEVRRIIIELLKLHNVSARYSGKIWREKSN